MAYINQNQEPYDYNSLRNVLWDTNVNAIDYQKLFSPEIVSFISRQITNYLMPLLGFPLIVDDQQIREIMTSVADQELGTNTPGIYTVDTMNIPNQTPSNHWMRIIDIVIQSITNQIKVTRGMAQSNYKNMDIWSQLYGNLNKQGLRAHPKIKLREKHPQYMMFNMNY